MNNVPSHLIDHSYASPLSVWPDHEGVAIQWDEELRARCIARHAAALERVLAAADKAQTILIVGHGASHDFIPAVLTPSTHPVYRHSPECADHVSLTTILRDTTNQDGSGACVHCEGIGAPHASFSNDTRSWAPGPQSKASLKASRRLIECLQWVRPL